MTPLQQIDADIAAAEAKLAAMRTARALVAKTSPEPVTDWMDSKAWTLENAADRLYGLGYVQLVGAWERLWEELSAGRPMDPRSREIHAIVEQHIAPRFQALSK